jgi:pimeloyl-ACP methyl ester carboxylesterase
MRQPAPRARPRRKVGGSRLGVLPPSRVITVRGVDGTRLHTEIFGPEDGYPIVLCHGITCALRVWARQIADLYVDHRVIAFDHRGHGRSAVPPRGGYSLGLLAADLNSVLAATLRPGERALIAGHSMGGVAITAWAERYRDQVPRRAESVALINTTTGDVLSELNLLQVPPPLASTRIVAAHGLLRTIGSFPVPRAAAWTSRRFIAAMAVGADADPAVAEFVYELFAATPPAVRGGCARMLADALGPRHIPLDGLIVPTLVIGSQKDRLLPIGQSRRIATTAPNVAAFIELPGGHCAMLEHPDEVNRALRNLLASAAVPRRASS